MLQLHYSTLYTDAISPEARFPRARYRLVREALQPAVEASRIQILPSRLASVAEIEVAHEPAYVQDFVEGRLDKKRVRRIGFRPWTPHFVERTLRLTGGTLQATEAVLAGAPVSGNMGGGTHHAYRDFGSGYCVFNDMAIAARLALSRGQVSRVAVVDLDVHQGDGTAALFAEEPRVLTFSMHSARNFPFRKQRSDLDLGLEDDVDAQTYLDLLEEALSRVVAPFRPELIFYQAGVDALTEDTLGKLSLDRETLRARNRQVFALARSLACPLVLCMGGGYADPIEASVAAHADLYLGACEAFFGGGVP